MTFAQKQVKIVMRILVNITYRHNAHYDLWLTQQNKNTIASQLRKLIQLKPEGVRIEAPYKKGDQKHDEVF